MESKVNEIKIKYTPQIIETTRPKITQAEDAYYFLIHAFDKDSLTIREEAVVLFLNRANKVIGYHKLSSGGITGTVMDPRLILAIALKTLACGIIVAHNHPSGEIQPSKQDIELTKKLKEAAALMEITLLDHLIVTPFKFYSFANEGII